MKEKYYLKFNLIKSLVWERDDYKCRYCGEDMYNAYASWLRWTIFKKWGYKVSNRLRPTVDHVFPKSKGGKTTTSNLVTCCYKCNMEKADKILSK